MGKIQMRKMQKNRNLKRKAAGPQKPSSGLKKGLRGVGQVLRKIVLSLRGLPGSLLRLSCKKDKR